MKRFKQFFGAFVVFIFFSALVYGQSIKVYPDIAGQMLNDGIKFLNANPGFADTIILAQDGGIYLCEPDTLQVPLVITSNPGATNLPVIVPKGCSATRFLWVRNDLTLQNLIIDGYDASSSTYDSVQYVMQLSETVGGPNEHPNLIVKDCVIKNIYKFADPEFSTDGTIFDINKTARGGDVIFETSTFMNTGDEALRSINTHKTPLNPDNRCWDSFTVRNCTFNNIRGSSIKIEGDADSTTYDGTVLIENNTFYGCYRRVIWSREFPDAIYRNLLITYSITGNDNFGGAGSLVSFEREGSQLAYVDSFACVRIVGIDTVSLPDGAYRADAPSSWSFCTKKGTIDTATLYTIDPEFADPENGDFTIPSGNQLLTLGSDGLGIGDRRWTGQLTGIKEIHNGQIPSDFSLSQNYPNPFNPQTNIQFSLAEGSIVSLTIYNIVGQQVTQLVNEFKSSGTYEYTFNASGLASGVYFYTLKTPNFISTKKMVVMK